MFYANLTYAIIATYLLYKLVKKDFNLFHVLIFVIPFHSWTYNIGVTLTIFQIIIVVMVLMTMFSIKKGKKNIFYFGNKYIIIFIVYAMLNTIIISQFFIDDFLHIGGFFRSEGRYLSQMILLLITFSLIPLAFNYIKSIYDIQKYLKFYLYALLLLCILGWLQYVIYNVTGIDMFPLSINQAGYGISGIYNYSGINIFRMSSLAGDPKAFSMALIIGFFIVNTLNRYGISFFKYDIFLKYLFLFTAFSTLSTSGIVLFAILFFLDYIYRVLKSKSSIKLNNKKILHSFIVIIIIGFLLLQYWDFVYSIIELRVFGRDIVHEDFDAPIQIFLSKFPEYLLCGSGLGNIHNLAYPYIAPEHMHYMENSIFVAKSGYLRIISELGLIGFSLFTLMTYSVYKKLSVIKKSYIKDRKNIISSIQLLLFLVLIAYFARSYVFGEYILFLAMANVIAYSKVIRSMEYKIES